MINIEDMIECTLEKPDDFLKIREIFQKKNGI